MAPNKTVLITGCSSGIGRALALEFHRRGHGVYATARRPETIEDLADAGLQVIKLDVNNPEDIKEAIRQVDAEQGGMDILINNAGFIAIGPMAEIPLDRLRLQFETNVTAIIAMTQAALPALMKKPGSCVVNMGSVSGILTTPFAGSYCATKAAVHALSDALRMELAPLGVKVITVQPGGVVSKLGENADAGIVLPENGKSLYADIADAIHERALASQEKAMPADDFAAALCDKLLSENPPTRIRLGKGSRLLPFVRYFLPQSRRDGILSKKFRLDQLRRH